VIFDGEEDDADAGSSRKRKKTMTKNIVRFNPEMFLRF
jgi:hypothetical protein